MWTLDKEIRLIEHYQSYRFLWDPFDGDYYRKDLRALTFDKIQQSLGDPDMLVSDVKKKIQHLRTSFTREARRKKLFSIYNEPGTEQKPLLSKWIHFRRMLFLKDVIEERGVRLQQETGPIEFEDEFLDTEPVNMTAYPASTTSMVSPITCPTVSSSTIKEELSSSPECSHVTPAGHVTQTTDNVTASKPCSSKRASDLTFAPEDSSRIAKRRLLKQEGMLGEEYFGYHVASSLVRMELHHREAAKLAIQQVLFSYSLALSTQDEMRPQETRPTYGSKLDSRRDIIDAIGQIINSSDNDQS